MATTYPSQPSSEDTKSTGAPKTLMEKTDPFSREEHLKLQEYFFEYRKETQDDIQKFQQSNIEVLAIFVAFFTFVSSEFALIKQFDFSQFLTVTPLIAAILLFFVFVLHTVIHKKESNWQIVISGVFLIALYIAVLFSRNLLTTSVNQILLPITK